MMVIRLGPCKPESFQGRLVPQGLLLKKPDVMECAPGGTVGDGFGSTQFDQREVEIKRLCSPNLDKGGVDTP